MHKLRVLVRHLNGILCRGWNHGESLGIDKPKLRSCVLKLKRVLTHCVLKLNRVLTHFIYLKFYYHPVFSLVITYIKLLLPTHDVMIVGLQDRSPLHMLPYPTHAHPMTSARGHAYSHPNPNDQNFQKRHGRLRPARPPTNVLVCGTPPSRRS